MDSGLKPETFIRIGRSDKISERLRPRCLHEIKSKNEAPFSRLQAYRYKTLKTEQIALTTRIEELQQKLRAPWLANATTWSTVKPFLMAGNDAQYAAFQQLEVPAELFGHKKENYSDDALWVAWFNGQTAPKPFVAAAAAERNSSQSEPALGDGQSVSYSGGIWALNKKARHALAMEWRKEQLEPLAQELVGCMRNLEKNNRQMEELRSEQDVPIIQSAQVCRCRMHVVKSVECAVGLWKCASCIKVPGSYS
jgi:hypothetical protein